MYSFILLASFIIPLGLLYYPVLADEYLNEIEGSCQISKKPLQCAKYTVFQYVDNYKLPEYNITSDSSVRIVQIQDPDQNITIFPESRQFSTDSEFTKILKFFKRKVENFVNVQGLSVDLPEGARVITHEGRKHKKEKHSIIFPVLTLLKLFKLEVMTAAILGVVLMIKKGMILAAIFLPSLIASIKHHCKSQYHVVPYHTEDNHYHYDHEHDTSGYGGLTGFDSDHHYKAWDRSKNKRFDLSFLHR